MLNNVGLPGLVLLLLILIAIWFAPKLLSRINIIDGRKVIGGAWLFMQIIATGITIYTFLFS